jgi:hypothetical protein
MKSKLLTVFSVFTLSTIAYAQIGINTSNPQAIFHIDGAKDNPVTGNPSAAQQRNDFAFTNYGHVGIGTTNPSEKLDIVAGNVRIRNINTKIGSSDTDRVVVADATGVLKTIDTDPYSLFHARLSNNQNSPATIASTLLFSTPISTSSNYSYNASTGVLTFNRAGNYLVTLQASFANVPAGTQLLLGIRPVPDADYLARGSHYNAVATTGTIGELMNYTTVLTIPAAGYQIRFTSAPSQASTILATETGSTGSGNVTNVTIQKI